MHGQPDTAEPADTTQGAITRTDPRRFINSELSWLAFDRRIVEEAINPRHPLFERVRFLSISASNLDEFMMVRIAALEAQMRAGLSTETDDGLLPQQHLAMIDVHVTQLLHNQREAWFSIYRDLTQAGITIVEPQEWDAEDQKWIEEYFHTNIFVALTPLVIDVSHPFPFITNGGVAIAMQMHDKHLKQDINVILPLPLQLNRFIRLPARAGNSGIRFVMLEAVVEKYMHLLFPSSDILAIGDFRVLRDSEIRITNNDYHNFMGVFESAVKSRYRGAIIRLTLADTMPAELREFLIKQLDVVPERVVVRSGISRLADIRHIIVPDRPELMFTPFVPRFPERIQECKGDCFAAISQKDLLIHHPYESFDVVLHFIRQAVSDPNVVAIKQTLYRTGKDSPIVKALIEAAEAGKSVTVVMELKARFDEEANIRWARDLERAGAHVVFGFMDLKTHAKAMLVIRRENNTLRSYAHVGTGNYHHETARVYADLSLFTCDPNICHDVAALFNFTTGYARPDSMRKIAIAPLTLRNALNQHIDDEIAHAKAGQPAEIWAKFNSLVDPQVIDKLYDASMAGVQIELIVRGTCCLRPGVPGLSENIRVKSIVGRFLEHSRVIAFGAGHNLPSPHAKVFISSADWMKRNLDFRVETLVPILNPTVHRQILNQILLAKLMDTRQSWELQADGTYRRADNSKEDFCAHDYFLSTPSLSGRGANSRRKVIPPRLTYHKRRNPDGIAEKHE